MPDWKHLAAFAVLPSILLGGEAMSPSRSSQLAVSLVAEPVLLQAAQFELGVSRRTGAFYLRDRATGEAFGSPDAAEPPQSVQLATMDGLPAILARFPATTVAFVGLPSGRDLDLRVSAKAGSRLALFLGAFWLAVDEPGYLVLPHALGCLVDPKANSSRKWRAHLGRDQLTMQMLGVVKNGSALVLSWNDLEAELETATLPPSGDLPARLAVSLRGAAAAADRPTVGSSSAPGGTASGWRPAARIRVCGAGDYATVARGYRDLAKEKGLLVPFSERMKQYPALAKLAGALEVKCFVKSGYAANCRFAKDGKEVHRVNLTFDEAAEVARHLRDDLGIEHCLFVLAGWIKGGYDFSHPDIWPPDDDLGGPDGLARAAKAARDAGYLFGLHDNYDMMFKAQPSATRDDAIGEHNSWAGGPQYVIHPKRQGKYAQRNLELVKACCAPDAYFCDQIMAVPLYQTSRKDLPLTYQGCVEAYRDLIRTVKGMTGVMGSEDGQEWAVPALDYHEGILSREFYPRIGRPVPLFDLVYHDCAALFWHQGFTMSLRENRHQWGGGYARPEAYLRLLSIARTPLFTQVRKQWWKEPVGAQPKPAVRPLGDGATFAAMAAKCGGVEKSSIFAHPPWKGFHGEVRGEFAVKLPQAERLTLQFAIGLRDGIEQTDGVTFRIEVNGAEVFRKSWAEAAWSEESLDLTRLRGTEATIALITHPNANSSFDWAAWGAPRLVGERGAVLYDFAAQIGQAKTQMIEIPRDQGPPENVFARADNGWAEGMHPIDAMLKNTYEFLSPTNRLAFFLPVTSYEERGDGLVRTVFGDRAPRAGEWSVEVAVNLGGQAIEHGQAVLPPGSGFIVQAPTFLAFHAAAFRGIQYATPALFTVRSLDGRPLSESARVRVFHGFGPSQLALRTGHSKAALEGRSVQAANGQVILDVKREAVAEMQ